MTDKKQFFEVYDDVTGKTLNILANTFEEALEKSEEIDFEKHTNGEEIVK